MVKQKTAYEVRIRDWSSDVCSSDLACWVVLVMLLAGFYLLEPLGVPVSAVAAVGALLLLVIAARGHVISTGKVLKGAPWQVVIFSLGMYLVVYGLRNAGLTRQI